MTPAPHSAVSADLVATSRRVEERAELRADVVLYLENGERLSAVLTDLTTRGCRVAVDDVLEEGAQVTVAANATMTGGSIVWVAKGKAGVEFGARLRPKALRALSC